MLIIKSVNEHTITDKGDVRFRVKEEGPNVVMQVLHDTRGLQEFTFTDGAWGIVMECIRRFEDQRS